MQTIFHQTGIYQRKESGAKRRCRESSRHHLKRGTCRLDPSPHPRSFLTSYCHHRRPSWAEAVHWACEALNRTATTANSGNKLPHEMWYGNAALASPHPFLRPGYCRWNRPSKSFPRCESSFYLGPGINYPHDSLRMLTRASKVVETRDVTWEALSAMVVPPVQLQQPASKQLGGRRNREERHIWQGHRSCERRRSREGLVISFMVHQLHCQCWGVGSPISVE